MASLITGLLGLPNPAILSKLSGCLAGTTLTPADAKSLLDWLNRGGLTQIEPMLRSYLTERANATDPLIAFQYKGKVANIGIMPEDTVENAFDKARAAFGAFTAKPNKSWEGLEEMPFLLVWVGEPENERERPVQLTE